MRCEYELPYRRWRRKVPARHLRILLALRSDYMDVTSPGLTARKVHHRSGVPVKKVIPVLTRLHAWGWVSREERRELPASVFGRYLYLLTPDGYQAACQVLGHRKCTVKVSKQLSRRQGHGNNG